MPLLEFTRLRRLLWVALSAFAPLIMATSSPADQDLTRIDSPDPYRWLEDVQGDAALAWVRARNAKTQELLQARPDFEPTRRQLLAILDSKDRVPAVVRRGDWLYNFWQDGEHERGLWRRTSMAEFRKPAPAWETVLDLDALAAAEAENWVWGGANCLGPEHRLCLISLSRGGADAKVVREFDAVRKAFVVEGFHLAEAKSTLAWIDANHLYVGTDTGPGSLTDSGYPRVIKRWTRGTPIAAAPTVFEGEAKDVAVSVSVDHTPGFERIVFARAVDFYNEQRVIAGPKGNAPFDVPSDASWFFWHSAGGAADTLLLELRSDLVAAGTTYPRGSLLASHAADYLAGKREFQVLSRPPPPARWRGSPPRAATSSSMCLTTLRAASKSGASARPSQPGPWCSPAVTSPHRSPAPCQRAPCTTRSCATMPSPSSTC